MVKETAQKWGLNPRTVQTMCGDGRIEGVKKFGKVWAITATAEKPIDKRVISSRYKNGRKNTQISRVTHSVIFV